MSLTLEVRATWLEWEREDWRHNGKLRFTTALVSISLGCRIDLLSLDLAGRDNNNTYEYLLLYLFIIIIWLCHYILYFICSICLSINYYYVRAFKMNVLFWSVFCAAWNIIYTLRHCIVQAKSLVSYERCNPFAMIITTICYYEGKFKKKKKGQFVYFGSRTTSSLRLSILSYLRLRSVWGGG